MATGTTGNDTIYGGNGYDDLYGVEGNDYLYGNNGNDNLYGGKGNDYLYGGEGNDTLNSEEGNDYLNGGDGSDLVSFAIFATTGIYVHLGPIGDGSGLGRASDGQGGIDSLSGIESVLSTYYNDTLIGGDISERFFSWFGDDYVDGKFGDDYLDGGYGNDTLYGDSGNDTLYGEVGNDYLNGGDGIDTVYFSRATTGVYVHLGPIDDGSGLGRASDGQGGIDSLSGIEAVMGSSFNDTLIAGNGSETLFGGNGNDTLDATAEGNDNLFGGIGNDVYQVSRTTDSIIEGSNEGIDTVWSSVTYILNQANLENLVLTGATNINGTGNSLDNQITGNSSNNYLDGSNGNDTLSGLDGNDVLNGGAGNDSLTGGAGSDKFAFVSSLPAAGVDIITDFNIFAGEQLILSKPYFSSLETVGGHPLNNGNPLLLGDFSVINEAAASEVAIAGTSQNEIVYNLLTGSLFYNPNDNMPGFGVGGGLFATIVGSPDYLTYTNFRVFF